jgi:uncharacterized protein involved in type VI secretion and phage assembly
MSWVDFAQRMMDQGLEGALSRFYSTYRGIVTENDDPERQDRVRVHVPRLTVSGAEPLAAWAYPVMTGMTAANGSGSCEVPPVGATVWVVFEDGQIDKPLYFSGGWWAQGEKPSIFASVDWRGWVSRKGHRFLRHDPEQGTGELIWQHADGQQIRQLEGGAVEVTSGSSKVIVEQGKVTLDTGSGQVIELVAGKVTIKGGANVTLQASSITLDAPVVGLGSQASSPVVKGTALVSYLTQLTVWLAAHAHAAPGAPPVPPPPVFNPTSLLSTKTRTG